MQHKSLEDLISKACARFEDNEGNSSDQMEVMIDFIIEAVEWGRQREKDGMY